MERLCRSRAGAMIHFGLILSNRKPTNSVNVAEEILLVR